jgi:hypothetical protein
MDFSAISYPWDTGAAAVSNEIAEGAENLTVIEYRR